MRHIKTFEAHKKDNNIKVVFQDIDGPLIPYDEDSKVDRHTFFDEDDKWSKTAMKHLNNIVKKTNSKVVISSSYRDEKTKTQIEDKMKKAGFEYEIYDLVDNDKSKKRGADIKDWMKNKDIENFIIIDDNKHDFYDEFDEKNIVKTTHKLGITKSVEEEAISKLK
jgi:hypothetical protein